MTSGMWSKVDVSLFGLEVADLFGQGATTTSLSAAIKAGEVHLIAHGYCIADNGATPNDVMINAISYALQQLGGGKIIFDRPNVLGNYYGIVAPILLRNNVTFEGEDASVWIHNSSTASNKGAVFHGNGMAESNYSSYAPFLTAGSGGIAAGAQSVTLATTGAGMPNFPVGSVILIFSQVGESPVGTPVTSVPAAGVSFLPNFSRQYRVVAQDATNTILYLDYAIPVAVPYPVVCNGTGGTFGGNPTHLIDRAVIRNLRVSSDSTTDGELIDSGAYEGIIHNVWVANGVSLVGANGMARMSASFTNRGFGVIASA